MNGDLKTIYEEIVKNGQRVAVIEERQKQQHLQNLTCIQNIKKETEGLSGIKRQVHIQWYFIAAIFLTILKMSL